MFNLGRTKFQNGIHAQSHARALGHDLGLNVGDVSVRRKYIRELDIDLNNIVT